MKTIYTYCCDTLPFVACHESVHKRQRERERERERERGLNGREVGRIESVQ